MGEEEDKLQGWQVWEEEEEEEEEGDQLRVNSFTGRSNTFDRAEQQHCLQRFATGCFHPLAKPFQHLFFEKLRLASRANQFYVLVI